MGRARCLNAPQTRSISITWRREGESPHVCANVVQKDEDQLVSDAKTAHTPHKAKQKEQRLRTPRSRAAKDSPLQLVREGDAPCYTTADTACDSQNLSRDAGCSYVGHPVANRRLVTRRPRGRFRDVHQPKSATSVP